MRRGIMDSTRGHQWKITFLVLALCVSQCRVGAISCDAGDSKALLEFKAGFTDPGNLFQTWQAGTSCCDWQGVNCTTSGRVQALEVLAPFPTRGPTPRRNPAYKGAVGATLGDLSELISLELDSIAFDGPIPNTLGNLKKLESLEFVFNNFSGSIPASIGGAISLKSLKISFYGPLPIVGLVPAPFPLSFCNLVKLQTAQLNSGMSGKIPECICRWNQVTYLDLSGNNLVSEIPNCIGYTLLKLTTLDLGFNEFTGVIPPMLSRLKELEVLRLNDNKFSGRIPTEISRLSKLVTLALNNNSLSGPIPASLGFLTKLSFLDMSFNFLTRIPAELGKLVKLDNFLLASNKLQGQLPREIGNAGSESSGITFDISNNIFSGSIPDVFGRFNQFFASNNFFSGGFPLSLAATTAVDLSNNFLGDSRQVGVLPASSSLQRLLLANNRFSGPVPSWMVSVFTASNLEVLDISSNNFTGEVPPSLFGLPRLQELNASYNRFDSKLPTKSFTLQGSFSLDLSHNRIYGPIPSSFFAGLVDVRYLDLSFNNLMGSIPANVGNMRLVSFMDLSDNSLSGRVPASIATLPSLEYLDLSNNKFVGDVPSKRPPPETSS